MSQSAPLLEIDDLRVVYPGTGRRARPVAAVNDVSLRIAHAETLGLVGESGSGKSTIGKAIVGLAQPASGRIVLAGEDMTRLTRQEMARRVQVVFQDPYSSLNPSRTIGATLAEPLRVGQHCGRDEARRRVAEALSLVGLSADAVARYPAQFSGGQRQRIAIARALVLRPELVICDEPTSALDLLVQAQILNLLLELQEQLGVAYLFISHDIDVVRHMSHRVAVLHSGRIVEEGSAEQIMAEPRKPYTRALLAAARHDTTEVA